MLANNLIAFTIAAITASAAPLAPRQGYPQGYLHVVSKDLSYNQEAVIDSPTNQVVLGQPNSGFTLNIAAKGTNGAPDSVYVQQDYLSCLTAHTDSGPSSLHLDTCASLSTKTGAELDDLRMRQTFHVHQRGRNYELVNAASSPRAQVHIVDGNVVHLTGSSSPNPLFLYSFSVGHE